MIEIERKFLVNSDAFKVEANKHYIIKQGFLNRDKARTVRIRLKNDKGYLTIKGKSSANGLSRFEWETEITKLEAEALLKLCEPSIIDKTRYEVLKHGHLFEIDVFYGKNEGLIMAEVELNSESETFFKPDWLGKEVTGDIRYYNSMLSKRPFNEWE